VGPRGWRSRTPTRAPGSSTRWRTAAGGPGRASRGPSSGRCRFLARSGCSANPDVRHQTRCAAHSAVDGAITSACGLATETVYVEVGDTGVEFHAQADSAVTDAADARYSSRRCGMPGRGCDQKSDVKHLSRSARPRRSVAWGSVSPGSIEGMSIGERSNCAPTSAGVRE
jgi:hypothetical protein